MRACELVCQRECGACLRAQAKNLQKFILAISSLVSDLCFPEALCSARKLSANILACEKRVKCIV